jgi:hypothetical protein
MGKAIGVLLVSAGLGLAAYAVLPHQKPPAGSTDDFDFGLNQPALSKPESASSRANLPPQPASPARPQPRSSEGAQAIASAPAVITVDPHNRPNPRLAVNATPKAGVLAADRTQLARELQKELRRVGCYDGEINGGWTTSTKRAMKTFTERVNASLPVEEPDLVLLSLVQGQADKICGRPCPAGETAADGGRCVPAAVATSPRKAAQGSAPPRDAPQPAIGWSATAAPSATPPLEGRMGLAGPDEEHPNPGLAGQQTAPAGLPRPSTAGSGTTAPTAEGRSAAGPSRRFDAQTFFRRFDKHSPN